MKIKKIISVLLLCFISLALVGCSNNNKITSENEKEEVVTIEEEKVSVLVAKFNTQIMDNGINTPAMKDYMLVENGLYWYGLTDDISIYFEPVKFSNNIEEDIAKLSAIFIDKSGYSEDVAKKYAKMLIKANNDTLTDAEIDELIEEANKLKDDKKMSSNKKGISFGIYEATNHYEFQVKRHYK